MEMEDSAAPPNEKEEDALLTQIRNYFNQSVYSRLSQYRSKHRNNHKLDDLEFFFDTINNKTLSDVFRLKTVYGIGVFSHVCLGVDEKLFQTKLLRKITAAASKLIHVNEDATSYKVLLSEDMISRFQIDRRGTKVFRLVGKKQNMQSGRSKNYYTSLVDFYVLMKIFQKELPDCSNDQNLTSAFLDTKLDNVYRTWRESKNRSIKSSLQSQSSQLSPRQQSQLIARPPAIPIHTVERREREKDKEKSSRYSIRSTSSSSQSTLDFVRFNRNDTKALIPTIFKIPESPNRSE